MKRKRKQGQKDYFNEKEIFLFKVFIFLFRYEAITDKKVKTTLIDQGCEVYFCTQFSISLNIRLSSWFPFVSSFVHKTLIYGEELVAAMFFVLFVIVIIQYCTNRCTADHCKLQDHMGLMAV